ncbi:uncharacterized protein LOC113388240 [Ctenocephalides felis]|uniref:uncharacterized protein LOC113388240 n=1 Tax=Ctenocephalides felis TaxID=7515 RepID=UPI000E6E25D0|nr:uncharacterized protein LOC113388240 [Ctenocephalides felis]
MVYLSTGVSISYVAPYNRFRRQGWSWGQTQTSRPIGNTQQPSLIRTTTRRPPPSSSDDTNSFPDPTVAMPPSPQLAACLARCSTTPEYNPVCASDGNTYHNRQRLMCQNSCTSEDIQFVRLGTCAPL